MDSAYKTGYRNGRLDRAMGATSEYLTFAVELGDYRIGYIDGNRGHAFREPAYTALRRQARTRTERDS